MLLKRNFFGRPNFPSPHEHKPAHQKKTQVHPRMGSAQDMENAQINVIESNTQAFFLLNSLKSGSMSDWIIMIVDFTVTNFRSFRDETFFSMNVEQPKAHLPESISYPLNDKLGVLRSAGIYGANASGKSNILLALSALQWLVEESGDLKEDQKLHVYEPYKLSKTKRKEPTKFEIEFIGLDNIRYIYSVSFNRTEITSEKLDFYPSRQKANIFTREEGDTWDTINFGSHYKGGFKRLAFFKNNSYLSKAGNNAAAPELIRNVLQYFRTLLIFGFNQGLSESQIYEDDKLLSKSSELLSKFDTGILNVTKKQKADPAKYIPDGIPDDIKETLIARRKYDFMFSHKNENGELIDFFHRDESDGTQKLFSMLPAIITSLEIGSTLIIDELDNSFHPHIAELIIKLFNTSETNKHNAQLIFTTHNVNLMSPENFRRDQIWFTEKNNGASSIYSLDEFDKGTVTTHSPFGQWYDEGRFGAVPHINFSMIAEIISRRDVDKENDESNTLGDNQNA